MKNLVLGHLNNIWFHTLHNYKCQHKYFSVKMQITASIIYNGSFLGQNISSLRKETDCVFILQSPEHVDWI